MRQLIKGYNNQGYIFRVCKSVAYHEKCMNSGFNHIFMQNKVRLYTYDGYIDLPDSAEAVIQNYLEGDVLAIDEKGIVSELYLHESNSNSIIPTLRCNSNCIMCPISESARRTSKIKEWDDVKEFVRHIPREAKHLTVTGGEPTLAKNAFLPLMYALQYEFNQTEVQLLSNGRAFADYTYTKTFVEYIPDRFEVGIPLYGFDEQSHDCITQENGSFKQTVIGIHNLLHFNVDVEIRIVLLKQNSDYIASIAKYIIDHFHGVKKVTIMGLELCGNAGKNYERVWLPYDEAFGKSKAAIKKMICNGIDVMLYNFPLCAVDKEYWPICANSISDYKVNYYEECNHCEVKSICGGLFGSTKNVSKFKVKPIGNVT